MIGRTVVCDDIGHKWEDTGYGLKCMNCGFVPPDPEEEEDSELCPHCNGDGWGLVGVDWDCEDGINGPYDGESQRCPWCNGSGKAKDVSVW